MDVEQYTPERQAEFLLSNTVDAEDYQAACALVRKMGLDPDGIDHYKVSSKYLQKEEKLNASAQE